MLPEIETAALATVAGASVISSILTGVVINAWRPSADSKDRFGPIVCLVISELVTVLGALATGGDLANAVIVGILVTGGATLTHSAVDAAKASPAR